MSVRAADVIVVGGGGAGLSAGISAATSGAEVLLLEKNPHLGGTTALAVGSYTAAGTSHQLAAGVTDSVDGFVADMATANGPMEPRDNPELRRVLAANAAPTFEWLCSLGVEFVGPAPEPPFRQPRMHNVVPRSSAYVEALEREARRRGVDIRTGFAVTALTRNGSGGVTGVSGDYTCTARRGVVLATGDYSANAALKAEHVSGPTGLVPPINPASTGDGFVLAVAAGGRLVNMDLAMEELRFLPPTGDDPALRSWVAPAAALFPSGAILVGSAGRRFANEQEIRGVARALAGGPANRCFIVFDAVVAARLSAWPHAVSTFPGLAYAYLDDYRRLRPDVVHEAGTVAELADRLALPRGALEGTVQDWNAAVATGADDAFGRADLGAGVRVGPFTALGPLAAFVTLTDGGVVVDTLCRVLDRSDVPVPGLYAAGSTGQGGLLLRNHGLHIAWAITSGRIAGRAAAEGPVLPG